MHRKINRRHGLTQLASNSSHKAPLQQVSLPKLNFRLLRVSRPYSADTSTASAVSSDPSPPETSSDGEMTPGSVTPLSSPPDTPAAAYFEPLPTSAIDDWRVFVPAVPQHASMLPLRQTAHDTTGVPVEQPPTARAVPKPRFVMFEEKDLIASPLKPAVFSRHVAMQASAISSAAPQPVSLLEHGVFDDHLSAQSRNGCIEKSPVCPAAPMLSTVIQVQSGAAHVALADRGVESLALDCPGIPLLESLVAEFSHIETSWGPKTANITTSEASNGIIEESGRGGGEHHGQTVFEAWCADLTMRSSRGSGTNTSVSQGGSGGTEVASYEAWREALRIRAQAAAPVNSCVADGFNTWRAGLWQGVPPSVTPLPKSRYSRATIC